MAKVTLDDLSTTLANSAAATLNANNTKLETALEKTLSRDGTGPNHMEADFDLNHNDILNVDNIHADVLVLNGQTVVPTDLGNLPATVMMKETYDPLLVQGPVAFLEPSTLQTFNGPLQTPYIKETRGALKISEFLTATDLVTDQSAAVTTAIKTFFDQDYRVLDFEGRIIPISQKLSFVCGVNGFTSFPTVLRNRNKGFINGGFIWVGADDPGQFMFELGCPASVAATAAFQDLFFHNMLWDSRGIDIGQVKIYNFYNCTFEACEFRDFNNQIAVFARSADNDNVYTDDNGLSFKDCRWACLPTASNFTGAPIKAYCGDIVVDGGFSEWSGPHDYHIGSVFIRGHHWSYSAGVHTEMRRAAIFRDAREIVLLGNDLDGAGFKFTNVGWLAGETFTSPPTHLAVTQYKSLVVCNNEMFGSRAPAVGEGWLTFETDQAGTIVYQSSIGDNAVEFGSLGDDAVDEIALTTTGAGTWTQFKVFRRFQDGFGLRPGSGGDLTVAPSLDTDATFEQPGRRRLQARSTVSAATVIEDQYHGATKAYERQADGSTYALKFGLVGTTADIRSDGSNGVRIRGGATDRWDFVSNGVFRPSADNTQNIGSPTQRVAVTHTRELLLGGGTIKLLTNAGTPEAVVTAPVGSICTDTTGGKLYIKATGTGNTGWVVVGTQT